MFIVNAGLKIRCLGPAFLFFEFNQPKSKHMAFVLYCPADHIEKGTVDKLEKSVDFPKQADNFHEASELILISQRLNDYDSPAFKNTLAKAVNGPISLGRTS